MLLFKDLQKKDYFYNLILKRASANSPRGYRYRKTIFPEEPSDIFNIRTDSFPDSLHNMVGFVTNMIGNLCSNYKHGKYEYLYIKKYIYEDGPRSTKKEPQNFDNYRTIVNLSSPDLITQIALSSCLTSFLEKKCCFKKMPSRLININNTRKFILESINNKLQFFICTDICKFGESFDIGLSLSTLIDEIRPDADEDDITLLKNVYNSFLELGTGRNIGSPISQFLGEWSLCRLDKKLEKQLNIPFIRFGEDFLFTFKGENERDAIEQNIQNIVQDVLGKDCHLHKIQACRKKEKFEYKWGVPEKRVQEKSEFGNLKEHAIDFCGYNYSLLKDENISVLIRYITMKKLCIRIAEYTNGWNKRDYNLPKKISAVLRRKMIENLNNLIGFHKSQKGWKCNRNLGFGSLFILPDGIDRSGIIKQARMLNHYMLRRVRHLHLRNSSQLVREYREEVDKAYRELGLKTLIDYINIAKLGYIKKEGSVK